MAQKTQEHQVLCEQGVITYLLTRKAVKNINVRIKPDGRVLVSANSRIPVSVIDAFIKEKQAFILSALARYEEKRKLSEEAPRKYVSGEEYHLFGKSFLLEVEETEPETVCMDGAFIFLRVRDKDDFARKERMMAEWMKEYTVNTFQELIDEAYGVFERYGVPYHRLRVRDMTSRWGSCQTVKGIITLNSRLAKAPRRCVEYVAVHEFAHFVHPNHSRQFWELVAEVMPDWKERRRELADI